MNLLRRADARHRQGQGAFLALSSHPCQGAETDPNGESETVDHSTKVRPRLDAGWLLLAAQASSVGWKSLSSIARSGWAFCCEERPRYTATASARAVHPTAPSSSIALAKSGHGCLFSRLRPRPPSEAEDALTGLHSACLAASMPPRRAALVNRAAIEVGRVSVLWGRG